MEVSLQQATCRDAEEIHAMQLRAFRPLLEKYQDFDTNPGHESLDRVEKRMAQDFTDYYIVILDHAHVGAIRIARLEGGKRCRISPIFILPQYQGLGIAQRVFEAIEKRYHPIHGWELDTILEEAGNCHLYEKMGYRRTGIMRKINERMTLVSYEKP